MNNAGGPDKLCEAAASYCTGALEAAEAREFEKHMEQCSACAEEVAALQDAVTLLAIESTVGPPDDLREKMIARVNAPAALVRKDEGQWIPLPFAGVEVKPMFTDAATGNVTSMVKLAPGALYPAHFHAGFEHCYVLEGDLVFQDHTLYAGDYEVAAVHSEHSPVTTNSGCLLLLINNVRDQVRL